MSYSLPLERVYLSKEFSREKPSPLRVVGTLLDGAFQAPPPEPHIERLCAKLAGKSTLH
jgi:hypothetical protein